ncbi:MAG: hypothetical protein JWM53_1156 [bacterium]|nr:hypothetical protein [bacterium]
MASLCGLLVLVGSGTAVAAGARVAALVPQVRPTAAPELRDRFHEAVTRGLAANGDEVVGAAEVRLRLGATEEMLSCNGSGACVARAAQTLRTDRLVASEIDVNGKDYVVKLRLLDAVGRELAKVDEACDICTVKEAEEAAVRAAGKLAAAAKSLPTETPPPATVETPPKVETPPAKVETPPPAKTEVVTSTPQPDLTSPATQREKKMFPWRAVAITSLVVGVVGLAIGIPLIAIDGNPTCSLPNPRQACPDVYNTVGGGAAMLTLGVAGVAASGVLFYFDHRARKRATAVSLLPLNGGLYLSAGGHF